MAWPFKANLWNTLRRRGSLLVSFFVGAAVATAFSAIRNQGPPSSELRNLFSLARERRSKKAAQLPVDLKKDNSKASWLTFEVVDGARVVQEPGGQVLMRQREEGLLCAKIADALELWGETSLSEQVWEQTRRILCVDDVAAAKERIRELLMPDGSK